MLDNLSKSNNIEIQYHKQPIDLTIDNNSVNDLAAFPVHVTVASSRHVHEEDINANGTVTNVRRTYQRKN